MPEPLDTPYNQPAEEAVLPSEPLGIKNPLLPASPLGQTGPNLQFMLPLGAKPLGILNPSIFLSEERSEYAELEQPFAESPFFAHSEPTSPIDSPTETPSTALSQPSRSNTAIQRQVVSPTPTPIQLETQQPQTQIQRIEQQIPPSSISSQEPIASVQASAEISPTLDLESTLERSPFVSPPTAKTEQTTPDKSDTAIDSATPPLTPSSTRDITVQPQLDSTVQAKTSSPSQQDDAGTWGHGDAERNVSQAQPLFLEAQTRPPQDIVSEPLRQPSPEAMHGSEESNPPPLSESPIDNITQSEESTVAHLSSESQLQTTPQSDWPVVQTALVTPIQEEHFGIPQAAEPFTPEPQITPSIQQVGDPDNAQTREGEDRGNLGEISASTPLPQTQDFTQVQAFSDSDELETTANPTSVESVQDIPSLPATATPAPEPETIQPRFQSASPLEEPFPSLSNLPSETAEGTTLKQSQFTSESVDENPADSQVSPTTSPEVVQRSLFSSSAMIVDQTSPTRSHSPIEPSSPVPAPTSNEQRPLSTPTSDFATPALEPTLTPTQDASLETSEAGIIQPQLEFNSQSTSVTPTPNLDSSQEPLQEQSAQSPAIEVLQPETPLTQSFTRLEKTNVQPKLESTTLPLAEQAPTSSTLQSTSNTVTEGVQRLEPQSRTIQPSSDLSSTQETLISSREETLTNELEPEELTSTTQEFANNVQVSQPSSTLTSTLQPSPLSAEPVIPELGVSEETSTESATSANLPFNSPTLEVVQPSPLSAEPTTPELGVSEETITELAIAPDLPNPDAQLRVNEPTLDNQEPAPSTQAVTVQRDLDSTTTQHQTPTPPTVDQLTTNPQAVTQSQESADWLNEEVSPSVAREISPVTSEANAIQTKREINSLEALPHTEASPPVVNPPSEQGEELQASTDIQSSPEPLATVQPDVDLSALPNATTNSIVQQAEEAIAPTTDITPQEPTLIQPFREPTPTDSEQLPQLPTVLQDLTVLNPLASTPLIQTPTLTDTASPAEPVITPKTEQPPAVVQPSFAAPTQPNSPTTPTTSSREAVADVPDNWSSIADLLSSSASSSQHVPSDGITSSWQASHTSERDSVSAPSAGASASSPFPDLQPFRPTQTVVQAEFEDAPQARENTGAIIPVDDKGSHAVDVKADSENAQAGPEQLEKLAREIYSLICQRLQIEQERNGNSYSGRLPW